ncbi:M48 family metallopeptidase [Phycicoccus sp. BSK3Z-2]|uniref:M48 family metallopeptidase n=1 Tax=Phycicoccus avicenniae TaxID=2828860 RepID=A0A941DB88_9MICO|nr:M48 family metallopeptidase [Phycicoccus avicenniae]MBR7744498.1 M48 family metallopeptidase [Phycicoccus avicenniae]
MALSLLVLLAAGAVLALWLWWLTRVDGLTRVLWLVLGGVVLWGVLPRSERAPKHARLLAVDEAADLHRLVGSVATAVGARTPRRIVVDIGYRIQVLPTGYVGGSTLVVGLPQWSVLTPDERVAALAHELACAETRRRPPGLLGRLANDVLVGLVSVLAPVPNPLSTASTDRLDLLVGKHGGGDTMMEGRIGRGLARGAGNAGLALVGAPVRGVLGLHTRLWRPVLQQSALDADRAAADVAGAKPLRSVLLSTVGVPFGVSAAENAARTGHDPLVALEAAERPDRSELDRRVTVAGDAAVDALHPPTARRLEALAGHAGVASGRVDRAADLGADADVRRVHDDLRDWLADKLRGGR